MWLGTIAASGAINYLAGYQFGRSTAEAHVFSILGASADAWKAIGPIFATSLWRGHRRIAAAVASVVWVACFVFAIAAALNLAAQNRSAMTGGREAVSIAHAETEKALTETEKQRARLVNVRSRGEVESAIAIVFARLVGTRGTVGTVSADCSIDHARTRSACAEVASLRHELAEATEAERLDEKIAEMRRDVARLRDQGGPQSTDPQAELISRLSFQRIAANDVGLGIVLLLVTMVELISAFAPLVIYEFAAVQRSSVQAGADTATVAAAVTPVGSPYEYMAARIFPDAHASVPTRMLYSDYRDWCEMREASPLRHRELITELDAIAARDLGGKVLRKGGTFHGFRLVSESSPRTPLQRRRA